VFTLQIKKSGPYPLLKKDSVDEQRPRTGATRPGT